MTVKLTPEKGDGPTTKTTAKAYVPVKVELPTEYSEVEDNMSNFSFFIYGHQKIGKTSLSTQFENPIHIMMEPGAKRYRVKKVEPKSWEEFEAYVNLLTKEETEYKTVVIDTVDLLWEHCSQYVCKMAGVEMLKDIGFGDGYDRAGRKLRDALIRLHQQYGLVCFSHAKDKQLKQVSQYRFDALDYVHPSCGNRCFQVLSKWCDLTGHYYLGSDGNRYMRIAPSADMEAGNRVKGCFQYKDGSKVEDVPMGASEEEAYKNLLAAFQNKLERPKPKAQPKTQ